MFVLKSLMAAGRQTGLLVFLYTDIFFILILTEVKLWPQSGEMFEILLNGNAYRLIGK